MKSASIRILCFASVGLLGVSGCAKDTGETVPTTRAAAAITLSALAPRAGYGVFEAHDGRCSLLSGDGLPAPVPVASVFKLWVLDALARSIADRNFGWDTPVTIRDDLRSDPSGEVYAFAPGRQVPVSELARLMIASSDNTAADHLIDLVGRDAVITVISEVAKDGASRTLPLLSTADMARLKYVHPDLGREYAALAIAPRAGFLTTLPERGPFPWPKDPTAINRLDLINPSFVDEIEWFASGADICRTMVDLSRLSREVGMEHIDSILSVNPGLPPEQTKDWGTTWFKGGSEPGVVALTYRLADAKLDRIVVIALSDPAKPLDQRPEGQQIIETILAEARTAE